MAIPFSKSALRNEKDKMAKELYEQKKANMNNDTSSLSGTATDFKFRKNPIDEDKSTILSKNIQCAKADKGKLPISLVPMFIIKCIAAIRKYGEEKYHAPNNWVLVDKQRYVDAMWRHLIAYQEGEIYDKESGLPHLWHAACNMAFILEMESPDWDVRKQQLIASDPKLQEQLKKYMEDNK